MWQTAVSKAFLSFVNGYKPVLFTEGAADACYIAQEVMPEFPGEHLLVSRYIFLKKSAEAHMT